MRGLPEPSDERLHCSTPGCRRSRRNEGPVFTEWVCQKCYDRVPPVVRAEHKAAKAVLRKLRRTRDFETLEAAFMRTDAAWEAVKRCARGGLPNDEELREIGLL